MIAERRFHFIELPCPLLDCVWREAFCSFVSKTHVLLVSTHLHIILSSAPIHKEATLLFGHSTSRRSPFFTQPPPVSSGLHFLQYGRLCQTAQRCVCWKRLVTHCSPKEGTTRKKLQPVSRGNQTWSVWVRPLIVQYLPAAR
jgi:hypothetical protein